MAHSFGDAEYLASVDSRGCIHINTKLWRGGYVKSVCVTRQDGTVEVLFGGMSHVVEASGVSSMCWRDGVGLLSGPSGLAERSGMARAPVGEARPIPVSPLVAHGGVAPPSFGTAAFWGACNHSQSRGGGSCPWGRREKRRRSWQDDW